MQLGPLRVNIASMLRVILTSLGPISKRIRLSSQVSSLYQRGATNIPSTKKKKKKKTLSSSYSLNENCAVSQEQGHQSIKHSLQH